MYKDLSNTCNPTRCLYLLQIFIVFQNRAPVTHIPVVAAAAAQRFRLRPDEPRVHDFSESRAVFRELLDSFFLFGSINYMSFIARLK